MGDRSSRQARNSTFTAAIAARSGSNMRKARFIPRRGRIPHCRSDSAPEVAGALELPDYGKGRESHSLGGIALPAIGDDGRQ